MDNQHLTACLILYQHRRDQALGIGWQSAALKGLLWYYQQQQQIEQQRQLGKLAAAAYLKGIIDQGAAEISMLVKRAKKAKNRHKIAKRVIELQTIVEVSNKSLLELIGPDTAESVGQTKAEVGGNG